MLGRHILSRETRLVSRVIKWKSLMSVVTFTTDNVITEIINCSNTRAFGPDKLSIFYLKNLGPRTIEYLTTLFNDSATSCRIPAIWKSYIGFPIPKPGNDSSLGTSYRPFHYQSSDVQIVSYQSTSISIFMILIFVPYVI